MVIDVERLETLRRFGLSEYGARGYLALLELGETEARDVAQLARIPIAKVYGVLDALQERGLCEIYPGAPKRFAPVPIERFLDKMAGEHARAIESLRSERATLSAAFPIRGDAPPSDRGRVQVVTGRLAVLDHEARMLASATDVVTMICMPGRVARMQRLFGELEAAHARGVKLRMLLPPSAAWTEEHALFSRIGEVRARDFHECARSGSVAWLVADARVAYVTDYIPDDGHMQMGHDVSAFITAAGGLAGAL